MNGPIEYRPDIEQVEPEEARVIAEIVAEMAANARVNFDRHRHAIRDAHAKSNAILKARLTVHDGLPAHLRQGVFAEPVTYDAVVRLSSAPGDIHTDEIPAPRGFAIKLIGVPGGRLLPELGGNNQDFLMVNFPVIVFGTIAKYQWMLKLAEKNAHAPDLFQKLVAGTARLAEGAVELFGGTPGAALQGLARDNNHPIGETYHTQAAIRFGAYIAKLSLAPKSANVRVLTDRPVEVDGFSTLRDVVVEHFRSQGAEYELRAQLCTDIGTMPVEDAAVLWDGAPHEPLATLTIAPQDAYSPARRVYGDDVLSFNPWNAVEAHRPLGSIMRVRKFAYESSTRFRHEANAAPRLEPTSIDQIPD